MYGIVQIQDNLYSLVEYNCTLSTWLGFLQKINTIVINWFRDRGFPSFVPYMITKQIAFEKSQGWYHNKLKLSFTPVQNGQFNPYFVPASRYPASRKKLGTDNSTGLIRYFPNLNQEKNKDVFWHNFQRDRKIGLRWQSYWPMAQGRIKSVKSTFFDNVLVLLAK